MNGYALPPLISKVKLYRVDGFQKTPRPIGFSCAIQRVGQVMSTQKSGCERILNLERRSEQMDGHDYSFLMDMEAIPLPISFAIAFSIASTSLYYPCILHI